MVVGLPDVAVPVSVAVDMPIVLTRIGVARGDTSGILIAVAARDESVGMSVAVAAPVGNGEVMLVGVAVVARGLATTSDTSSSAKKSPS